MYGRRQGEWGTQTHHVEGDDILEGYVACLVALDEGLVYQDRTASCRQAQDKGTVGGGVEGLDALWMAGVSSEALWRARVGSTHQ